MSFFICFLREYAFYTYLIHYLRIRSLILSRSLMNCCISLCRWDYIFTLRIVGVSRFEPLGPTIFRSSRWTFLYNRGFAADCLRREFPAIREMLVRNYLRTMAKSTIIIRLSSYMFATHISFSYELLYIAIQMRLYLPPIWAVFSLRIRLNPTLFRDSRWTFSLRRLAADCLYSMTFYHL